MYKGVGYTLEAGRKNLGAHSLQQGAHYCRRDIHGRGEPPHNNRPGDTKGVVHMQTSQREPPEIDRLEREGPHKRKQRDTQHNTTKGPNKSIPRGGSTKERTSRRATPVTEEPQGDRRGGRHITNNRRGRTWRDLLQSRSDHARREETSPAHNFGPCTEQSQGGKATDT